MYASWLPCVRLFPRVRGKCPQSGQKGPVSGRKAVERSETEGLSYTSCSLGRRESPSHFLLADLSRENERISPSPSRFARHLSPQAGRGKGIGEVHKLNAFILGNIAEITTKSTKCGRCSASPLYDKRLSCERGPRVTATF